MISICIPIYNFNVLPLVEGLRSQCLHAKIDFEILCVDDKSEDNFKTENKELSSIPGVRYVELEQNIGRSAIRNYLAEISAFDYLLFMDCDSKISGEHFMQKYIEYCKGDVVICGGRIYENVDSPEKYSLRWLYGTMRESRDAEEREKSRYNSFLTNNFLISKKIIRNLPFSEAINTYGHEDTLFSFNLKKNNIRVIHIDNPLIHIGEETAEQFIQKTDEGLKNLAMICHMLEYDRDFFSFVRLLDIYRKTKVTGLYIAISIIFFLIKNILLRNLKSNTPYLRFFDFYKLAVIIREIRKSE